MQNNYFVYNPLYYQYDAGYRNNLNRNLNYHSTYNDIIAKQNQRIKQLQSENRKLRNPDCTNNSNPNRTNNIFFA